MGRLLYSAMTSLDGYTVDASGSFDWAFPAEEIHGFVNDLERRFAAGVSYSAYRVRP